MCKGKSIFLLMAVILLGALMLLAASEAMTQNAERPIRTNETILAPDGTKFIIEFDKDTNCGVPVLCIPPREEERRCEAILFSELLEVKSGKKIADFWTPGNLCDVLIIQDDSENSTYYCVNKRCYY
jgi:hypothetical protein